MKELAMWIGQAQVLPRPGDTLFEKPCGGGFIVGVAYARDAGEFARKLRAELGGYGVDVANVSDPRPLREVLDEKPIEVRLHEALDGLSEDGVRLGTLFTYPDEAS
jgi:hypothetical protein